MESVVRAIGHGVSTITEGAVHSNSLIDIATAVEGAVHSESPMNIAATHEGVVHSESPMDIKTTTEGAVHSESPKNLATILADDPLGGKPMDIATQPYHGVIMRPAALDRTEIFWDIARSEGFTDASALRDVLQRYGFRPPSKTRYAQIMASEVVDTNGKAADAKRKVVDAKGKAADVTRKAFGATGKAIDAPGKAVDTTGRVFDKTGKAADYTGKAVDNTGKVGDETGKAVDSTGEAIDAMLLVNNPADVMRALVSLHMFEDMKDEASVLTRELLSRFMRRPIVFSCMWMASGLRPEAVFRAFGFDWNKLDRISLIFLDELMEYIGLFKEVHPSTSSADDTAKLLFDFKDAKGLDAHLKEIADQPGHDALASSLHDLYLEVEDFNPRAKREYYGPAIRRHLSHESTLVDDDKFWSFAGLKGPIDVKALKKYLDHNAANGQKRISEREIIKALLLTTGPTDVVQALLSLHASNLGKQDAIELSKKLVLHYYREPGVTSRLWMELGLDPKNIYDILSFRSAKIHEILPRHVYEWFTYIELYRAAHPKSALGPEEAANLLVRNDGTKGLGAWVTRLKKYRTYTDVANTLSNIYEKRRTKEANTLLANTGT
ncbi:unnamed protein product [Hyaloperonospora brassicae]|uniref:RxLR effector candidate protein n=1 Tax=Hyaloperonospora brassicae TaxID=162125 RepID=A0AAV0TKJ5_HYABA|nr:unnamed protein product [Hyaloperonospora brassicae]